MSDLNDERTENQAQRGTTEAALAERLGALSDHLTQLLALDANATTEAMSVRLRLDNGGVLVMRRGAPVERDGVDEEVIEKITYDEKAQSDLDAVYRLLEQLDALEMRERGPHRGPRMG